jgi:uncharacterized protein (DUF1501 family)
MAHDHNCCNNYTRSQLMRSAASEAGKGLPAIERGMPLPAGTGLSRRSFLSRSAGLAMAVYGATKLPLAAFEEGIAHAQAGSNRVLVSLFFDGGIDALNVLAPINNPTYETLRPTLKLENGLSYTGSGSHFWHSSAAGLRTLDIEGKVTSFPAIGYTGPDQSHFTSRHFYEIGEVEVGANTGWLGRYLDIVGEDDNPLQGVSFSGELSPMLATASKPVAAIDSIPYEFWTHTGGIDQVEANMFQRFENIGGFSSNSAPMTQARRAITQTAQLREQLEPFGAIDPPPAYPDTYLGRQLASLVAMLAANMPINVVTLNATGGYDTHSDQATALADNLQETSDAVLAFQRDLEARGLDDRVLLEMWSEFGRRPEENGSGTDHGAAGVAFIVGKHASGTMIGAPPSLTSLDEDDNLINTSDYRGMYAALLDEWLGVDPEPIIPDFGPMPIPTVTDLP